MRFLDQFSKSIRPCDEGLQSRDIEDLGLNLVLSHMKSTFFRSFLHVVHRSEHYSHHHRLSRNFCEAAIFVNRNGNEKPSTMHKEIHKNSSSECTSQLFFVTGNVGYLIPEVLSLYWVSNIIEYFLTSTSRTRTCFLLAISNLYYDFSRDARARIKYLEEIDRSKSTSEQLV
jgi:hypothetical protein